MSKNEDFTCRCPVSQCTGIVSFIEQDGDDPSFYGCGDFGHIWYDQKNLLRDIDISVSQYTHRKLCYVQRGEVWISGFSDHEPVNISELIEGEAEDKLGEFIRD